MKNNEFGLILKEIQTLHEQIVPEQLVCCQEKATPAGISKIEEIINDKLPPEFVFFYTNHDFLLRYNGYYESLSFEQMLDRWETMNDLLKEGVFDDGRVEYHIEEDFGNWTGDYLKKVWWSPKWIPFAEDSCGNLKCIDLDPGSNGKKGQIISMEIQDGQGPYIDKSYTSFGDYISYQLELIKNKQYSIEERWDSGGKKATLQINSDLEPGIIITAS